MLSWYHPEVQTMLDLGISTRLVQVLGVFAATGEVFLVSLLGGSGARLELYLHHVLDPIDKLISR